MPDSDLFAAISNGSASVVTDRIATFTETGIRLESGRELDADIVVTATGLNMQAFGGLSLTVDGQAVNLPDTVAYRGMMLSGVPNFAYAVGYTNSSWTLKIDLVCERLCRLLTHMDVHGYTTARPNSTTQTCRPARSWISPQVMSSVPPTSCPARRPAPWLTSMDYQTDVKLLREDSIVDSNLTLTAVAGAGAGAPRWRRREPLR